MKFNINQNLKFSFACLLSSMCILVFSFFTLKSHESDLVDEKATVVSEAISWDEAQALMSTYKKTNPLLIEISDLNSPDRTRIVPLEGFKIKASQLLEIINKNKSADGKIADNVMFYFGASDPQPNFTTPEYRIIAVGEKNGSLMIPTSEADKADKNSSSIFDKADPCPPMCPK